MHSVLVVDDEPFVRVSLASLRAWEEDGFEFLHEASNGRQALEVLAVHPEIDIVLVDLSMPILDGIEFLRQLPEFCHKLGRKPPAPIVLSAFTDFPQVREAFTLGARDYILKAEVEGEKLLSILTKVSSGLNENPVGTSTILQRRHREQLKHHLLKDLLVSSPSADWQDLFTAMGIPFVPPLSVIALRIEEIESIQERYAEEGLDRFRDMVRRTLVQVLARHGEGEVISVSPWVWVTFLQKSGEGAAREYGTDAVEYIDRYLSIRVSFQETVCGELSEIPEKWKELSVRRRIESRIVIVAKRFLREHYADEGLNLETVSHLTGVSKNHLSWEFSRETGETLMGYLAKVRIDKAKSLLSDPGCRVSDAGIQVGYPNIEHFSRVFKKLTGISPNKWSDFMMNPSE